MTFKTTMKGLNRLGEITMGDLGIHLVTFLALIVSLGIGIHKLLSGPTIINTLAISVVWIIYAAIPIWLLIWFAFLGRGTTLHLWCRCARCSLSLATTRPCQTSPPLESALICWHSTCMLMMDKHASLAQR
jgi:hypothetical protein